MKAVVVTQPGEVRIVELNKPTPGPYQALVRPKWPACAMPRMAS